MNKRHIHADVIHAWAEGEEVEYRSCGEWVSQKKPSFHEALQWRVKPKTVKKEGWVNVYGTDNEGDSYAGFIWSTEAKANEQATKDRIACIRIEWEETE